MLSTDYSEPYSSHLWNADDICPLGCHKVQVVYPHKLFSTVSICGQVFTMNKQFISSILRPTCFTYLKTDCVLKSMASHSLLGQWLWLTQMSQPVQEETWSKLFILLPLPCLRKYQIALSIRIKKTQWAEKASCHTSVGSHFSFLVVHKLMVCLTVDGFLDLTKCSAVLSSQACLSSPRRWLDYCSLFFLLPY